MHSPDKNRYAKERQRMESDPAWLRQTIMDQVREKLANRFRVKEQEIEVSEDILRRVADILEIHLKKEAYDISPAKIRAGPKEILLLCSLLEQVHAGVSEMSVSALKENLDLPGNSSSVFRHVKDLMSLAGYDLIKRKNDLHIAQTKERLTVHSFRSIVAESTVITSECKEALSSAAERYTLNELENVAWALQKIAEGVRVQEKNE